MSLTGVIDVFQSGTYTFTRTAKGSFTNGRYTKGATSNFSAIASIQPVTGRELQALPEAYHEKEVKIVFTKTALQAGTHPDQVTIDSVLYEVFKVEKWDAFGDTHYRASIVGTTAENAATTLAATQDGDEQSFQFTVTVAGTSHTVTLPANMTDASYTVSAEITEAPAGLYTRVWAEDSSKTTTQFTLKSLVSIPIDTVVDIIVRDYA